MDSRFDRDTALVPLGDGRFEGRMDRGWWIERGPNGGYVAAVILRGLTAAAGDPVRTPRSLNVQYLSPPAEGAVELSTTVERAGRQLSFVSGRLLQEGRLLAVAHAVVSAPASAPEFDEVTPPDVPPPESLERMTRWPGAPAVPMRERYDSRWAIGAPPLSGADRAEVGGWIRLAEERPADQLLLTALSDAWIPPVYSRFTERIGVPTIDLTVHFRAAPPPETVWFLVRFRTRTAREGFLEEDGRIWTRDGLLVAQSRQLALMTRLPRSR